MQNEPRPTWEGKTDNESAMIIGETFHLNTPLGSFFSEHDVEVTKVTQLDGHSCFSASTDDGHVCISEEFYKQLSQTPFSTEIQALDTVAVCSVEGFEFRLAGLHLPPHKRD